MALQRSLPRPPITEALVDLRTSVSQPEAVFKALAEQLKEEFPNAKQKREITANFQLKDGQFLPPTALVGGFQGIRVESKDETLVAQFRPDGFTLNNVRNYLGGDVLLDRALELWTKFAAVAPPVSVNRVAWRYINSLALPLANGESFDRYLTAAPKTPEGSPQDVSEFLIRVVSHPSDIPNATAIVTQRLKLGEAAPATVLMDIDVFERGEFPADAASLRPILERLRLLRNQMFFSHLTQDAVDLFI